MGAYLSAPVTEKEVVTGTGSHFVYAVACMQGWRRTMEDSHVAVTGLENGGEEASIFGIYDGHGGSEVAKFCALHLHLVLLGLDDFKAGRVEESLVQAFHKIDDMLRDDAYLAELEALRTGAWPQAPEAAEGGREEEESGGVSSAEALQVLMADDPLVQVLKKVLALKQLIADSRPDNGAPPPPPSAAKEPASEQEAVQAGCTAVVAVMQGRELVVASAGDSRAVLCRDGSALALSEDHKPYRESERKRITAAGGFLTEIGGICRVNGNLNLSRAIGDLKYKNNSLLAAQDQIITAQPDVLRVTLCPEDRFFLLACDGVWDVMDNQEAVHFVLSRLQGGKAPEEVLSELLDACLAKDPSESRGVGCDNMTAALVVLQQGGDQHCTLS